MFTLITLMFSGQLLAEPQTTINLSVSDVTPQGQHEGLYKVAPLYIVSAIDLASTWKVTRQGCYREANPLLGQNKVRQAVVVFGTTAAVHLISGWLDRRGDGKLAWIARGIHLVGHSLVAGNNLRLPDC